jgi:hypothetical protein
LSFIVLGGWSACLTIGTANSHIVAAGLQVARQQEPYWAPLMASSSLQ